MIEVLQNGSAWVLARWVPAENNGGTDECFWNGVSWSRTSNFAIPFKSKSLAEDYLRQNQDNMLP